MALDESALPELLDALRAGDGIDLIRDAVRLVMQELIELEADSRPLSANFSRNRPGSAESALTADVRDGTVSPRWRASTTFESSS